ncbi:MAG: Hpt domain-containing protein [Planctomycetota bacterium]
MSSTPAGPPIESAFKDDPDMMELVEMFVDEMGDRIASMESAFGSSDWTALQTVAHQLKGASGGYGFDAVGEAAASLEGVLKSGSDDAATIKNEMDALTDLCRRVSA